MRIINCKKCNKKVIKKSNCQKYCAICRKKVNLEHRKKPEIIKKKKEYNKKYYQKNREEINRRNKKYYQRPDIKAKAKIYRKEYYQKNKEEILKKMKEYFKIKKSLWENLSEEKQLKLINKKSKEIMGNLKENEKNNCQRDKIY